MSWFPLLAPPSGLSTVLQRFGKQRPTTPPTPGKGFTRAFNDSHLWGVLAATTNLTDITQSTVIDDTIAWLDTTAAHPLRYETAIHELAETLTQHAPELSKKALDQSANPSLTSLAARTAIYAAYANRGRQPASQLTDEQLWGYLHYADLAAEIIDKSTQPLQSADLTTQCYLARTRRAGSPNVPHLWTQALTQDPHCWHLAFQVIEFLRPAWGGSAEKMLTFAHNAAAQAPQGSPVKATLAYAIGWIADMNRTDEDNQWIESHRAALYAASKKNALNILDNTHHVTCPSWPMIHQLLGISMAYIDEPDLATQLLALTGPNVFTAGARICTQANYERIVDRLNVTFLHTP